MNKRLIIKFILFSITLLPSLKSGAQNVFFGDTLRFDSTVTYKLLHSIDISKKYYIFTTFNPNRSLEVQKSVVWVVKSCK